MTVHAGQQTAVMAQIKAARALLGWSQSTLAKKSRRAVATVVRAEEGRLHADLVPSVTRSMQRALETAGVEFLNHRQPGVRLRKGLVE